jgi:hypothetical protein
MLDSIVQFFSALHFQYTEQFLAALLPMSLTVMLHGYGMDLAIANSRRSRRSAGHRAYVPMRAMVLIVSVAIMLLSHFLEVSGWAMFYFLTGMIPDYREAMYLSMSSYTTLGNSTVTLPGRWHGLSGFEAMTAMLMFGWSTAVMVDLVRKVET